MDPAHSTWTPARAFVVVFALATAARVWVMLDLVPPEYLRPHTRWEAEAVAVSLATRGTFADPYAVPTGPTAHVAPVWPLLMSLVYRVVGLTPAAGYVTWIMGIVAYASLFALLPWAGARLGLGVVAGTVAGGAGAVLALTWPDPTQALAGLAMLLLLVAFLRRWEGGVAGPLRSLGLGLAGGAALHVQPSLLPVILGCVAFELWWRGARRAGDGMAALVLGLMLACLPWGIRNYRVLGAPILVRSNAGLELRMAFHEGAAADLQASVARGSTRHPRTDPAEALRLRDMGEIAYMREASREGLAYIRTHPGRAARLVAGRVARFWFGPLHQPMMAAAVTTLSLLAVAGLVRRLPALTVPRRAALLIPLITFPLVYYVVGYMTRYRIPLDWLILLCAASAVAPVRRVQAAPDVR